MVVTVRAPMKVKKQDIAAGGAEVELRTIDIQDVVIRSESILSIDGSTSNTGMCILTRDGNIIATMAFKHETDKENAIQYKVRMKRVICDFLRNNKHITEVFYEEPFIGYVQAAKNLLMLRTFIEEIKYENEPEFDYLKFTEINNLKWKRLFLAPDKCPSGTEAQKKAVREKLVSGLPILNIVTQDEIDAICMGFVAVRELSKDNRDELETKKKARPFKYEIQFLGADSDDGLLSNFGEVCTAPQIVMETGVLFIELDGRNMKGDWDQLIYNTMGQDDKLIIFKFPSNKCGNIILKYRLGHLTTYEYIYAIIWRTSRKKLKA